MIQAVQNSNPNQQVAFKSSKSGRMMRRALLPMAAIAILTFAACKNSKADSFEKTNDIEANVDCQKPGHIDNVRVAHFDHTGDAVYITQGNKETRIQFDNNGNVYGQYTTEKDAKGNTTFDTYHYLMNGKSTLDAYHVIERRDDNTNITECYDRDGDLISKDSTVYEMDGSNIKSSTTHLTIGPSKLNN